MLGKDKTKVDGGGGGRMWRRRCHGKKGIHWTTQSRRESETAVLYSDYTGYPAESHSSRLGSDNGVI